MTVSGKTTSLAAVDLEAARDPTTSPDRLQELARKGSHEVRDAVAENPNALVKTLLLLSKGHAAQVGKNASLPFLILTGGNSSEENKQIHTLMARVLEATTDPEVLRQYSDASQAEWRRAVADNPHTPVDVLESMVAGRNESLRKRALLNPSIPLETLLRFARKGEVSLRQEVIKSPRIPIEVLRELSADPKPDVRLAVAQNPFAPTPLLSSVSKSLRDYPILRDIVDTLLLARTDVSEADLRTMAKRNDLNALKARELLDTRGVRVKGKRYLDE